MIVRGVIAVLTAVLLGPLSAVAQIPPSLELSIEPTSINTTLGQTETVSVTVTNSANVSVGPLAVHIDITDPSSESSVDPEDWTPTLTQEVRELAAGESDTVVWEIQPISSGSFSVYVVALLPGSAELAVSKAVVVNVESSRVLNPQGILPVAVASPLLIGALLIVNLRRSSSLRRERKTPV